MIVEVTRRVKRLSSVQRIWRAHGMAPHRIRTFKLSNDPKFAAKVRDIVGRYPPEELVVVLAPARPRWLGNATSSVRRGRPSNRASGG